MLLVAAISYFVNKSRIRGRKILDFLGFAPIALLAKRGPGHRLSMVLSPRAVAGYRQPQHHRSRLPYAIHALCVAFCLDIDGADS